MKKRAVIVFFISLALLLEMYFDTDEFLGSSRATSSDIKDDELGENNAVEQNIPDEFLFVLLGTNKGVGTTDHQRSDIIMVCRTNFSSGNVDILSVPRDTQIKLNGNIHEVDTVHAYEGVKGSLKALRNLLEIDLDYYVEVDFDSVEHIVDTMGGVEVNPPAEVVVESRHVRIPKGKSKLNGDEALQYIRTHHPLGGFDEVRVENRHYFIKTLLDQLLSPANITKMPKTTEIFEGDVKTNIPLGDMTSYLTKLPNFLFSKIHSYMLPGEYENGGVSWYMTDEEQLSEIVSRLLAECKLDDQTTNRENNENSENEKESQNN